MEETIRLNQPEVRNIDISIWGRHVLLCVSSRHASLVNLPFFVNVCLWLYAIYTHGLCRMYA